MTNERLSRRALLRRLGAGAAMVPLLHAERARAGTATGFPKRLVLLTWTNGIVANSFFPPGTELTIGETLKPLEPWKAKMLMPTGLDMKVLVDKDREYDGHFSYASLWTGTADAKSEARNALGPSIDQFISDAVAKTVTLKLPLLNLGMKYDGDPTSWRAAGQKNVPETDPYRLFDRLFAGTGMTPGQIDQTRARRQSVLDFVNQELTAFGRRLGTDDRLKMEAHKDSVRELEKRLQAPSTGGTGAACGSPSLPARGTRLDTPALLKALYDLMAMALRCDITRVATLDMYADGGGDGNNFPWVGVTKDYHDVAHDGPVADKVKIDAWLYGNVANFIKQLDDAQEAGGTALDHTVVVCGNDMGTGNGHSVEKIPFLLIGSCGGFFKTGRIVKYAGVPHNRLLASLCNAMDVPVPSYGSAGYGGTLPELSA